MNHLTLCLIIISVTLFAILNVNVGTVFPTSAYWMFRVLIGGFECLLEVSDNTCVSTDDISVRNLSDKQLFMLKENLIDFKDCVKEENNSDTSVITHTFIHSIVCNSAYLMCEEDVMDLGLSSHALAKEILLSIEEIEHI